MLQPTVNVGDGAGHRGWDLTPLDPLTLTMGPLALILTALMACYVPARRAATADPKAALRYD